MIDFDKALVNVPLLAANWFVTLDPSGTMVPSAAVFTSAQQIRLTFAAAIDPASVTYLASPPEVVGAPPPPAYAFAVQPFTMPVVPL